MGLLRRFLTLALLLLYNSCAATDARCANKICDLSTKDPNYYADTSECDSDTCTESCIANDPAFESLLKSLGTGTALREETIHLPQTNWLSAQFPSMIFKILATEVLRFRVESSIMSDGWSILCCPAKTVLWLEQWPGDPFPEDPQGTFYRLPNGYTGFANIYVPRYVTEQYPFVTSYKSFSLLSGYADIFPKIGSMACNETLIDQSLSCGDETNTHCYSAAEYWPNTTCTDGRYVPPQCVNNPDCMEIIYGEPIWDTGFFESVIKNLGLNFTFVYVGIDNAFEKIVEYAEQRRNFIFYMSGPDAILAKVPSDPLVFPQRTVWCEDTFNKDPTLSGANCSYPNSVLYKTGRADRISANPDLKRLFDTIELSAVKLQAMMAEHESGGGTMNLWNVTCNWVKNNHHIWQSWIQNTPPPQVASSSALLAVIGGVVGGVGSIIVIAGGAFFVYQRKQALKAVENAPTTAPLALIFTDVESSTNLWEAYPEMAVAMDMHHDIIRKLILEHQCYEVKTIGDSFMIACNTLGDAVTLCIAIQRKLHEADWPTSLKYWKGDEGAAGVWHGLRVRAGVHWCTEVEPKLDSVHGRYDYYGHDVNVSARVESMADGGQTMMTQETFQKLTEDADFEMLCEEMSCIPFCRGAELKGVVGKVCLYSLVPLELAARQFKPVAGAEPCAAIEGVEVTSNSGASMASAAMEAPSSTTIVLRKYVEDLLAFAGSPSDREKAVTQLLVKYKIATLDEMKRVKFPKKVQLLLKHVNESLPAANGIGRQNSAMMRVMSIRASNSAFVTSDEVSPSNQRNNQAKKSQRAELSSPNFLGSSVLETSINVPDQK